MIRENYEIKGENCLKLVSNPYRQMHTVGGSRQVGRDSLLYVDFYA